MRPVAEAAIYLGFGLLAVGFIRLSLEAWQRRDGGRLDVLAVFALLLADPFARDISPDLDLVRFLPWALLRAVLQFRHVPRVWISSTLVVALLAPLASLVLRDLDTRILARASTLYAAGATLWVAYLILGETQSSRGVKKRRLLIAAIGTAALGSQFAVAGVAGWFDALRVSAIPTGGILQTVGLVCYFFAFATPRSLIGRWRRAEQARYLGRVMERDPEVRGERAADDLFQAAVRGAGGAFTVVALRPSRGSRVLEVAATSDARLDGRTLTVGPGLVGFALRTGDPGMGRLADCEPDIAAAVVPHGERVLVAPIVANARSRGVVIVGQRRGSLFPEDDLAMLRQVARNAATALDHAELIRERRDDERAAADRRLRQMESRVELMLDSIKDYAMAVLDAAGRVTAWQPGARHVFGHARSEIVGCRADVLFGLTPPEFSEWLNEARMWGSARREGACTRADGTQFIGTTIIRPLIEDAGSTPGFVVVTHDVTDRRNLEERLRQGQKMEAIGQLAGGVAHDFNNLLTAILGYADWLSLELAGDRRQEQVAEIQKAAERAAELTRQLLAFSRRQMLHPAPLDLTEIIADLVPMLRRLVGERIVIHSETTCVLPSIMGDRTQVERVLVNLAVNARDAMPAGGRLTIRTSDVWLDEGWSAGMAGDLASGPHVLLEVIDTGVGMTAEIRRRVFEPFFTTKEVGAGTGLGLSTVYGMVQQMGGAIEVQSEPNAGAQFRVYFPLASEPAVTGARRLAPAHLSGGSETVLLVEDEDAVRTYLTRLLESHGYRVIASEDAANALARMERFDERIDLILSDVVVPGSTGPELERLLGASRSSVSVLYMSDYEDATTARSALAVSADRLLLKPFSSTELLTKIRQILEAA